MTKEEFNKRERQRFLDRNKDSITEIHKLIESNELRLILMTGELLEHLKLVGNLEEDWDSGLHKYNGVRVIFDSYLPLGSVYCINKEASIKFNVPCICGIYSDEPHNHKLK